MATAGRRPHDPFDFLLSTTNETLTLFIVVSLDSSYHRQTSRKNASPTPAPPSRLLLMRSSPYIEEIHELLLSFAEAGANLVRVKGGDPLVFGRGGEEMDFHQQKGIQVKVIPGITAASGISAELRIPLTHRGVANSVRFLTGHSRK
ncbi:hypothetical protein P3S67_011103 [Capsicum chacoense]